MKIYKDLALVSSVSFSLLALIISIFMVAGGLYGLEDKIILNIGRDGSAIFGYAPDVFSVLAIFGAIIVINSILILEIYNRKRFVSYALASANIVISVIVSVAVYMIVSLN